MKLEEKRLFLTDNATLQDVINVINMLDLRVAGDDYLDLVQHLNLDKYLHVVDEELKIFGQETDND